MKLLKNERIKYISWKKLWLFITLVIALNIIGILIVEKVDKDNWKDNAMELKQIYTDSLEECIEEGVEEDYYIVFEEQIQQIEYSLEHNIPYGIMTAKKHILRMTEMFQVLVIVFMFLISSVVSNEYEAHTWKNLLMTGVSKQKIFNVKIAFCYLYALGLLFCYFFVCTICGLGAFGVNTSGTGMEIINGTVVSVNEYIEIFKVYLIFAMKLIFYTTLTITTVIFLRKNIGALLIVSILSFSNGLISSMISIDTLNNILPFRVLSIKNVQHEDQLMNMAFILGIYCIALLFLARIKFEKSDIL